MSDLLMRILAITIGALLGIAGIYYGGSAFTTETPQTYALTVQSQAGAIAFALNTYDLQYGQDPSDMSGLTSANILTSIPTLPSAIYNSGGAAPWNFDGTTVSIYIISQPACTAIAALGNAKLTCTWSSGAGAVVLTR